MLIKINESGFDFEHIIDELKSISGESTASKAVLFAINEYAHTKDLLNTKRQELEKLESTMEILKILHRQKNQAIDGIEDILK